jgi:hypothetical protein
LAIFESSNKDQFLIFKLSNDEDTGVYNKFKVEKQILLFHFPLDQLLHRCNESKADQTYFGHLEMKWLNSFYFYVLFESDKISCKRTYEMV